MDPLIDPTGVKKNAHLMSAPATVAAHMSHNHSYNHLETHLKRVRFGSPIAVVHNLDRNSSLELDTELLRGLR